MRSVELHLMPEGRAFPGLDRALKNLEGIERETLINLEWHNDDTYTMVYRLTGTDIETLEDLLASHEQVLNFDVLSKPDDRIYVFVRIAERQVLSDLLEITEENGILLETPFRFTEDGIRVTIAGDESALQVAYTEGSDTIQMDVESTGAYSPDEPDFLTRMTDRQHEALVTAHELGYYDPDETVSFEEVAEKLGCAPSTANELLRRAEAALVSSVVGE